MAGTEGAGENKAAAPSGSPGGSPIVLILSIVNLLVTVGMVAVLFLSFKKEQKKTSVEDIAAHAEEGEKKKEGGEGGEGHGGGEGGEGGEGKAAPKKKQINAGKMITLDQFTVNLSTPGSVNPKFVRVNISIEAPNDDTEAEVNAKMPQVRNTIIDLFNSKRPSDLATSEGREYLKEEIRNAVNSFLISGKVKGVFFTSFSLSS